MRSLSIIVISIGKSKKLTELIKYLSINFDDEIILVDNSSDMILKDKYKRIKYIHESAAGSSSARNCGARYASGDMLLFLDDDILPGKDFKSIINKYKMSDKQFGVVGGKVIANKIPDYIPQKYEYIVGSKNYGNHTRYLKKSESFGGCTMLILKKEFEKVGGFDISFGHLGETYGSNEDVLIQKKLKHLGLIYEPLLEVTHYWKGNINKVRDKIISQGYYDEKMDWKFSKITHTLKLIKYHFYIIINKKQDLQSKYDAMRYKAYVQSYKKRKNK